MRIDPHAELPDSADGICTVPAAADNTVVAVSADHMGEGDEVLFRRAGLPGRMIPDRGGLRSGVEGAAAGAGRALHRIGHSSRRS